MKQLGLSLCLFILSPILAYAQTVNWSASTIDPNPPDNQRYEKAVGFFTSTSYLSYFLGTDKAAYILDPVTGTVITVATNGEQYERAIPYYAKSTDTFQSIIASAGGGPSELNLQIVAYINPANSNGGNANAPWSTSVIYAGSGCHDLSLADFDGDGLIDVACSGTPASNKPPVLIFQNPNNTWSAPYHSMQAGESVGVVAVNGGPRNNLVGCVNDGLYWYENPGGQAARSDNWPSYYVGSCNSGVVIAGMAVPGRDIILVASGELDEGPWLNGFAYYDPTSDPHAPWTLNVVDNTIRVVHSMPSDTLGGVAFATVTEMEQASPVCNREGLDSHPGISGCRVAIFVWNGNGFNPPTIVSNLGSHNQSLAQLNGIEYMGGANHNYYQAVDSAFDAWTFSFGSEAAGGPTIANASVNAGVTSAIVSWTTNDAVSSSVVNYGLTASYDTTKSSATLVLAHWLSLTGLACATTYHYQISSTDGNANTSSTADATFTTGSCPVIGASLPVGTYNFESTAGGNTWDSGFYPPDKIMRDYSYNDGPHQQFTLSASGTLCNLVSGGTGFCLYDNNGVLTQGGSDTFTILSSGIGYTVQDNKTQRYVNPASATGEAASMTLSSTPYVWTAALQSAALPVISNVVATPGATTATVTWTTNVAASSTVSYGLTATYGQTGNSPGLVTGHTVSLTGLTCGTTYHYQVTSVDANNNTVSTTDITFQTSCAVVISNVVATPGTTTATVTWTTNVAASSTVSYGLAATYGQTGNSPGLATGHTVSLTGLTCGTIYHYQVTSVDGNNNTVSTTDITFQTSCAVVISNVVATPGTTTATVTWTTNVAASSTVSYGLTATYGQTGNSPGLVTGHTVSLTGLTCGTTYHYQVTSVDANNNTVSTTDITFQTSCAVVISNVVATPGTTTATVTWTTNVAASSTVSYGLAATYGQTGNSPGLATGHTVSLAGLTCGTIYHYQVTSVDGNNNTASTTDSTFLTTGCVTAGSPTSDDFHSTSLNTGLWTFVNPLSDSTLTLNGTNAVVAVPGGVNHELWTNKTTAPRLMQATGDVDFSVEAKFDIGLTLQPSASQSVEEGIMVEQDIQTYIRFALLTDNVKVYVYVATFTNGQPTTVTYTSTSLKNGQVPLFLRVQRSGSTWTMSYSADGTNYTVGSTFVHSLSVSQIGPYAANAGASSGPQTAPAFTASIDYFFNTANPIFPEDGGADIVPTSVSLVPGGTNATVTWSTADWSTSSVNYGTTSSYGMSAGSALLALAHSVLISGLTCGTSYHYQVTSAAGFGGATQSTADSTFSTTDCGSGGGTVLPVGTYNFESTAGGNTWDSGFYPPDKIMRDYSYNDGPHQQFTLSASGTLCNLVSGGTGFCLYDNNGVLTQGGSDTFMILSSGIGYTVQDNKTQRYVNPASATGEAASMTLSSTPYVWTAVSQ